MQNSDYSILVNLRANIEQLINLNVAHAVLSCNYATLESDVNASLTALPDRFYEKVSDHTKLVFNIFNEYLNDPEQAERLSNETNSKIRASLKEKFITNGETIRQAVKNILDQKKSHALESYAFALNVAETKCDEIWRNYHGGAINILLTAAQTVASTHNH